MEKRVLGRTGLRVSVLGFGGAEIGYESAAQGVVDRIVAAAADNGVNVIDTAECYGDSEEMLGRALVKRRDKFFLFTKCGHSSGIDAPDWSRSLLEASIDRSLTRLRTDHLDLVQLHSCSAALLEKGEVVRVLQDAQRAGKTRFIGYSGDGSDALAAVNLGVFHTLQTSINLADQEPLELTLPEAVKRNMGIIAKRPLANAAWKYSERPSNSYYHVYWQRLRQLEYPILTGDVATGLNAALRFTLAVPGVSVAITGTKSEERWRENVKALAAPPLAAEDFEAIRTRWHERSGPDWVGQV
ncbi:MAG: aldo/keto reductase [Bryobacteraceae bacterium]|nr:aldo/keto reductase [Bryobacteraceae bacterium]